jgi:hypothetical protein
VLSRTHFFLTSPDLYPFKWEANQYFNVSDDGRTVTRDPQEQELIRTTWCTPTLSLKANAVVFLAVRLVKFTSFEDDTVAYAGKYGGGYRTHDFDIGLYKAEPSTEGWLRGSGECILSNVSEVSSPLQEGDVLVFRIESDVSRGRVLMSVRKRGSTTMLLESPIEMSNVLKSHRHNLYIVVAMRGGGDCISFARVTPADQRDW